MNLKGFFDFTTFVGFFLILVIYLVGFQPIISQIIADAVPSLTPTEASLLLFVPVAFLIAFLVNIFRYAFGKTQDQYH